MEPFRSRRDARSFQLKRGFTLVELMVVITIMTAISGIVLGSQSSFNKTLILANTAYDVALTLRSAETYGLGNRAVGGLVTNAGYGVNFQKGIPGSFTLFADTYPAPSLASVCHPTTDTTAPNAQAGDCSYASAQDTHISSYTLGNGVIVSDFCAFSASSWSCAYANGGTLSSLDIVFARPNPDPFISVNGLYSDIFPVTGACIKLSSPQGGERFIAVGASGDITANATSCP